ncbi:MAG: sigma-70 family RNA polymerase sigma factor [Firmicutes bacterium]|nr:sigma-70 family RNA polymerase sigma factor [Bacillota bacterium]
MLEEKNRPDANQMVDLDLIKSIRQGKSEDAKERLVVKYVPMVKYIIRNYYASFLDFDDLLQEGLIGLLNAIEEYKPHEYDVKFSSFAYICIIRRVYNVIKQTTGNKHRLLNEAVSLQSSIGADENRTVFDVVPDSAYSIDPVFVVEEKTVSEALNEVLQNHLSILEYAVMIRLLRGYTCSEIEQEIGVGPKVIDNARTRVKTKLRKLLTEHGSLLSPHVPTNVRRREDLYLDVPISR